MNRYQWQKKMAPQRDSSIASCRIQHHYSIATEKLRYMMLPVMEKVAHACGIIWNHSEQLNIRLGRGLQQLNSVRRLYCIDINGYQLSRSIGGSGAEAERIHGYRQIPFMREITPGASFIVSKVYYNYATNRQTVTVVHVIKSGSGALLGYLCAELDMADLMLLISQDYLSDGGKKNRRNLLLHGDLSRDLLVQ